MSKYVDDLIKDIQDNPTSWTSVSGSDITKGNILIYNFCLNPAFISVGDIKINKQKMPMTYIDRFKMEHTIRKWYMTVDLKTLSK